MLFIALPLRLCGPYLIHLFIVIENFSVSTQFRNVPFSPKLNCPLLGLIVDQPVVQAGGGAQRHKR